MKKEKIFGKTDSKFEVKQPIFDVRKSTQDKVGKLNKKYVGKL